ncbi:MAG: SAM-dependent chlorinase/fluorinase [Fluviicola sp.]|nr:SAM-dependent chlorinase/fluorinase [Fluviicola sp.]MBP6272816.1 SAM-dependent chlorinase/fluorinase [Fluviicola sp.]
MKIITLTTDMGINDYYVAVLKGNLFKLIPDAQIVDITHHVKPFEISNASYYINAAFENFPAGTIHIIGVESEPIINNSEGAYPAIMLFKGHYFIATDNGIFSLILKDEQPEGFWFIENVLSNPSGFRFPTKNIFVPIAAKIAGGEKIETFASPSDEWKVVHTINATIEDNLIKGQFTHIDHYGNAITNISKALFDRYNGIPFTIYFKNKQYFIDQISHSYNEVTPGERLALFNDAGLLEIAINKGATGGAGGADALFGIRLGDVVRIEFNPRGSAETITSLFS